MDPRFDVKLPPSLKPVEQLLIQPTSNPLFCYSTPEVTEQSLVKSADGVNIELDDDYNLPDADQLEGRNVLQFYDVDSADTKLYRCGTCRKPFEFVHRVDELYEPLRNHVLESHTGSTGKLFATILSDPLWRNYAFSRSKFFTPLPVYCNYKLDESNPDYAFCIINCCNQRVEFCGIEERLCAHIDTVHSLSQTNDKFANVAQILHTDSSSSPSTSKIITKTANSATTAQNEIVPSAKSIGKFDLTLQSSKNLSDLSNLEMKRIQFKDMTLFCLQEPRNELIDDPRTDASLPKSLNKENVFEFYYDKSSSNTKWFICKTCSKKLTCVRNKAPESLIGHLQRVHEGPRGKLFANILKDPVWRKYAVNRSHFFPSPIYLLYTLKSPDAKFLFCKDCHAKVPFSKDDVASMWYHHRNKHLTLETTEWEKHGITLKKKKKEGIEDKRPKLRKHQLAFDKIDGDFSPPTENEKALIREIFYHWYLPETPESISADEEFTLFSMFPFALLRLYSRPEEKEESLELFEKLKATIQLNIGTSLYRKRKIMESNYSNSNYIMMLTPSSNHFLACLNNMFYSGITCLKSNTARDFEHIQTASRIFFNDPSRSKNEVPSDCDRFAAEKCWRNKAPISIETYQPPDLDLESCFLLENSTIRFLLSSPLCQNGTHGNTSAFSKALQDKSITIEQASRIGAAILFEFFTKKNSKFVKFTELSQKTEFVKRMMARITDKQVYQEQLLAFRNNPLEAAPRATNYYSDQIPSFSLLNDVPKKNLDMFRSYALHLFASLFCIPPKLAFAYLFRKNSRVRVEQIKLLRRIDILTSIASVVNDPPTTLKQCLDWAGRLFTLLFVTNVKIANSHLAKGINPRHPNNLPVTCFLVRQFLASAALLRAQLFGIQCSNGEQPTMKSLDNLLKNFSFPTEVLHPPNHRPLWQPIEKFSELANVSEPVTNIDKLKNPENIDYLHLTPIDFQIDSTVPLAFVQATARLRCFSYFGKSSAYAEVEINLNGEIGTRSPYFQNAAYFPQFI